MTKINYIEIFAIARNVMIRDMEDDLLAHNLFCQLWETLTNDLKDLDDRVMISLSKLSAIASGIDDKKERLKPTLDEMFNLVEHLRVLAQEQQYQIDLQKSFNEMNILEDGE